MSSSVNPVPPLSSFRLSGLAPLTKAQQAEHLDDIVSRFEAIRSKFGTYEVGEIYDTPFNGPRGSTARQLQSYAPKRVQSNTDYTLKTKLFHKWSQYHADITNVLKEGLPAYSLLFYGMTATGRWLIGECDFMEVDKPKALFETEHVRLHAMRLLEPSNTRQLLEWLNSRVETITFELFRQRLAQYRESLEEQLRKVDSLEDLLVASDLFLSSHSSIRTM